MLRRTNGTNQNFIAPPSNADLYSAGRQDKPLPQTFKQFVTPAQLENIDEERNLGEHNKLRVSVSEASGIKSSRNGHSLSRTTKGACNILSRCLSSSS